jgi:hypothetical protein
VGGSTTNVTGLNCTTALTVAIWAKLIGGAPSTDIIRHTSTANVQRQGWRCGFGSLSFQLNIADTAGNTSYAAINPSPHRDGRWHHYLVTFDDAANVIRGYVDGALHTVLGSVTRDLTAAPSCTTTWNPNAIGNGNGFFLFDFQILPDIVVPPQDVRLLMDPRVQYPGVKGRYFGLNFNTTAAGTGACIDESGNGNNLTISPSAFQQGEEPPWRSTYQ